MTARGLPTVHLGPDAAEVEALLRALQLAVLQHPVAAASLYRALIAEGRSWSRTPDGRAMRERLAASPLLDRVRLVFEKSTGDWLSAEGPLLPSTLAEAVVLAAGRPDAEAMLDRLSWGGAVGEDR